MPSYSPSGSLCPYYYKNGELHPLKYGGYFKEKDRLFEVMKAEEAFIMRSSGQRNRRIWIDLYETKLDREVIRALALHMKAIEGKILRLCFVGCPFFAFRRLKHEMERSQIGIVDQMRLFSDPEKAKQWLVQETD